MRQFLIHHRSQSPYFNEIAAEFLSFLRESDAVTTTEPDFLLELMHYEPLTLPGMESLAGQALERFALDGVLVWHRVGTMHPGEAIVLVAAAARHRRDAFHAVDFLMDYLKSAAWLWKRELRPDGWHWIEPRAQDFADRNRWE